jgi:peroxiredoxin
MRKLLLLMAAAATLPLGLLSAGQTPQKAPAVPRKAPEFVFKNLDGSQQLLSSYRGKSVVLAMMFTTCPHCQNTAQILQKLQAEYSAKGVQMLGVVFDQGAAQRAGQFRQMYAKNFPISVSEQGQVLEFLGLPPTEPYFVPILVFIDKKGTLRSQYIGDEKFLENQEVNIRAEIEKLLKAGAAPAAK